MNIPTVVSRFEVKPLDTPDERRTPEKTQVDVVHMDGVNLGRFTVAPGWRWSTCIKRYEQFRELLAADPEWHDGHVIDVYPRAVDPGATA